MFYRQGVVSRSWYASTARWSWTEWFASCQICPDHASNLKLCSVFITIVIKFTAVLMVPYMIFNMNSHMPRFSHLQQETDRRDARLLSLIVNLYILNFLFFVIILLSSIDADVPLATLSKSFPAWNWRSCRDLQWIHPIGTSSYEITLSSRSANQSSADLSNPSGS